MAACRHRRSSRGSSEESLIVREDVDEGGDDNRVAPDEVFPEGKDDEEEEVVVEHKENGEVKKSEESSEGRRIATGVLDTISQKYESLDYEVNFNSLMLDEIRKRGRRFVRTKVSWRVFCQGSGSGSGRRIRTLFCRIRILP